MSIENERLHLSEKEAWAKFGKKKSPSVKAVVAKFQEIVDELAASGIEPYVTYLKQHKLKLIDSKFEAIDVALDAGLVKIK